MVSRFRPFGSRSIAKEGVLDGDSFPINLDEVYKRGEQQLNYSKPYIKREAKLPHIFFLINPNIIIVQSSQSLF